MSVQLEFDEPTHTYKIGGKIVPSVTQILQSVNIVDSTYFNVDARQKGTFVHKATALYDMRMLDTETLDPQLRPYLDAWVLFLFQTNIQIPMYVEEPIFHETLNYGCTPDRKNESLIVEIKTNKLPWWCAIQTAGQELAIVQGVGPHAPRLRRIGVELHADGSYKMEEYKDKNDREVFLGALAVHQRKLKEMK